MKIFGIPEDYCKCFLILFIIAYFMMNSDLNLNIIEGNENKKKNKKYEIRCNKNGKPTIHPFEKDKYSTESKVGLFKRISKKLPNKLPKKQSKK